MIKWQWLYNVLSDPFSVYNDSKSWRFLPTILAVLAMFLPSFLIGAGIADALNSDAAGVSALIALNVAAALLVWNLDKLHVTYGMSTEEFPRTDSSGYWPGRSPSSAALVMKYYNLPRADRALLPPDTLKMLKSDLEESDRAKLNEAVNDSIDAILEAKETRVKTIAMMNPKQRVEVDSILERLEDAKRNAEIESETWGNEKKKLEM